MRVEYIRDGLVEESHEGIFIRYSEPVSVPENVYPYYLRSCAKPLQASLLIDFGADLTEEELALCCGSHAGEECHVKIARQILKKYDIDERLLKCGVHNPLSRSMQDKMLLRGEKASEIHNNCSGKHIGFLVCCKLRGWDMETYYEPEHPLQQAVKKKIYEMCNVSMDPASKSKISVLPQGRDIPAYPATTDGCSSLPRPAGEVQNVLKSLSRPQHPLSGRDVTECDREGTGEGAVVNETGLVYPATTDGCGVPILSMPLYNMLVGYINLLKYDKIVNAMLNHPYIFGGENRLDTEIIQRTNGIIAKVGAGGLCVVVNVEQKDAFVVKINDCSMDARRLAVLEIINRLGWGNIAYDNKIKTLQGKVVGEIILSLPASA